MIDFDGVVLADLLTAAGAGIAATIVTLLVDLWKVVWAKTVPALANIDGVFLSAVFALVLYVFVGADAASGGLTLAVGFSVFLAWLTCTAAAVGVHKAVIKPMVG